MSLDSEKMTQLMILGFTEREARLGLRACQGNVEEATIHISNQRQVTRAHTRAGRQLRVRCEGQMSCFDAFLCVCAVQEQMEQRQRERRKRSRRLEVISILTELGYSRREASRAAHLAGGDVDKAYGVCPTIRSSKTSYSLIL